MLKELESNILRVNQGSCINTSIWVHYHVIRQILRLVLLRQLHDFVSVFRVDKLLFLKESVLGMGLQVARVKVCSKFPEALGIGQALTK